MKKINRYVNYFEYSNIATDFVIKAYNVRNKQVRLLVLDNKPLQYEEYEVNLAPGKQPPVIISSIEEQTEIVFDITNLTDDNYTCTIKGKKNTGKVEAIGEVSFELASDEDVQEVRLGRPGYENTDDEIFWEAIKRNQLNFNNYFNFISKIMYKDDGIYGTKKNDLTNHRKFDKRRGQYISLNEYNMLKFGTEFYMLKHSALNSDDISAYLSADKLPYYEHLSESYREIESSYPTTASVDDKNFINSRFKNPFFIELIWSYWMEQGMLMQTMSLINLRFQNLGTGTSNSLSRFDISPLRALSHILWGFIQDEQHRLSLPRRVQEYDHEYGLILTGRAVPSFTPADSRTKFLEAFHNLLTTASIFYKEADDTTRIADAFPVLNSLKEVHLLLAEGNHNAYGNLTWTARNEMLMTQYIIAREEIKQFLGGRPMVPYAEGWMDRIDTMRNMMGWGGTSITYFYDLATHGEKILLAIRYGDWSDANIPVASAANWALAFRDSIQKYIHGYRTVTGVDLSADANTSAEARSIQPAILIQRRIASENARIRRA